MLLNRRKHGLPKRVTLVLLIITLCFKHIARFVRSFAISSRSFALSAISGKNDNRKAQLRENRKILVEIGNSLKGQDVKKALSSLDDLLEAYTRDRKLSKNMSTICGNVLNLCSKYNDINSMINVIEKMKKHNIEMQENSFLAICNYYITNNYIYEYLLTINKMIQKNITIRERFYRYILVHVLDLPLGGVHDVSGASNKTEQDVYHSTHINNKRCNLIKNIDYSNFEKHFEQLEKYNIPHLSEEDKKYILNNYLLIDIFKHMNENRVKIKLLYILKLIHYVYENLQHLIRQSQRCVTAAREVAKEGPSETVQKSHIKPSAAHQTKAKLLSDVLTDQLRDILELYKMNYESMSINIKKYDDEADEEEKRTVFYQVNKIIKKLPFIKLTENVKNTFNCKNCQENINTYFLSLKHTIIVIVNIILITHLFNSKEIFKIKHFFSILNGAASGAANGVDVSGEGGASKESKTNEEEIDASVTNPDDHHSSVSNTADTPRGEERILVQDARSRNKLFERGTYTCLLDGANIGYNKQNVENGRFSFLQIEILKEIIKRRNNETPLIILPKIYHYKNSLKHLQQCESENEGKLNSSIFIPNKTIKVKKGSWLPRKGGAEEADEPGEEAGQGSDEEALVNEEASRDGEDADRRGAHPLAYIRRMFNKLDPTDVEIIKKWESEKCLYICNYNMYDDYYYILGSLARSNNLFNICTYVDRLAKHFHKYQNLNHNIIIDNYTRSGDKETYNGREILNVYNNIIFDTNNQITVLVSSENMDMEKKYISMNEQYYNDQIKKRRYSHVTFFEKYKDKLTFRDKDSVPYSDENVFMETYLCDSQGGNVSICVGEEKSPPQAASPLRSKPKRKEVQPEEASTTYEGQQRHASEEVEGKNFYYSNIYVKCIKDVRSVQKPIYIYTNDKMKNHYFNEYTNYILKKWKKKSFISFYFKQPIFMSDLLSQSESNWIDLSKLISTYKLPFVNLENPKLYIDDIVSYRDKGIYHIKINTPSKTFLSYQNENLPFLQSGNNVVRYLCIDFSKVYRPGA
ncbi:hypothetical protein C922_01597 [Plasmodium inui San Antonio 1]|uniref:Pentatricopeptide repeat-containing protein-mitochondrial domain-containing protein n=1 Tax=Plasmodium inui San Antonio 1 TaxID=1237626 RepID=W7A8E8_9APIC|nr:hypothetical protein C922_01597 [Plasmodium inui San Antonio 1]EUD67985.1 hypothetical protein C922_01597 [Plasmodium inui San Antonio 1]